jgi:CRP-like cAMP-binding protein
MFPHRSDGRVEALGHVPLFRGCSRDELATIARVADETTFEAGDVLMREGQVGREAFVLLEGEAKVTISGRRLATLHAGDIVGEMALLEHEPRVATVTAREDIRALVLTDRGLTAVLDASPNVAWHVMETLAQRLRKIQAA